LSRMNRGKKESQQVERGEAICKSQVDEATALFIYDMYKPMYG